VLLVGFAGESVGNKICVLLPVEEALELTVHSAEKAGEFDAIVRITWVILEESGDKLPRTSRDFGFGAKLLLGFAVRREPAAPDFDDATAAYGDIVLAGRLSSSRAMKVSWR